MLFKLAWRNIWRNKRRSIIVMSSVVVGVIASLVIDGFENGMITQMLKNQISLNVAHIQIHKNGFADDKSIENFITNPPEVSGILDTASQIIDYSKRVIAFGLISSPDNSSGVYLYGVEPEKEGRISVIKKSIIKGRYLSNGKRELVLGKLLADKLSVDVGDKVVLMSNTPDGSIGSDAFRIVGIFSSPSSEFDKTNLFIGLKDAQNMLEIGDAVHEFAIILSDYHLVDNVKKVIVPVLGDRFEVLTYKDNLPLVVITMDMYKEMIYFVNMIIGLALIFGIINSMLMSVYERIQEIGVLMSIGMKNSKIVSMILMEALIIGVMGTLVGLALGYGINAAFLQNGIDLSVFSESLHSFGVGAVIYPEVSIENLISLIVMLPLFAVIGAFYPAYKAIKLEPVYAIRYV